MQYPDDKLQCNIAELITVLHSIVGLNDKLQCNIVGLNDKLQCNIVGLNDKLQCNIVGLNDK